MSKPPDYNDIYDGDVAPMVRRQAEKGRDLDENVRMAWHQLDDETDPAYKAFLVYMDMGRDRSQAGVAKVLYSSRDNISRISVWATKHRWLERADAFDRYYQETRSHQIEQDIRDSEDLARRYLPRVTSRLARGAAGLLNDAEKPDRVEGTLMKDYMDRFGPSKQLPSHPVQVNNWTVKYPELPGEVSEPLQVEEADYEMIEEQAENLIPDKLKRK